MVSIYEAEIKYQRRYRVYENQLTSRVFGALAMLPRDLVLCPFLKKLAQGNTSGEVDPGPELSLMAKLEGHTKSATPIRLWERMGNRYPDVCIDTDKVLIVIEVKKDTEQPVKEYVEELVGQYKAAYQKANNKKLAYFLLTKHERPPAIQQAQDELKNATRNGRIYWRRWTQVWEWLRDISKSNEIDNISKMLLDATIKLIEEENMNGPIGFKDGEEGWRKVREAFLMLQERYLEINKIMKEVVPKAEDRNLKCLKIENDLSEKHLMTKMPNFIGYRFKGKEWKKVVDIDKHPSLQINFELSDFKDKGVSIGLWWPIDDEDDRHKNAESLEKEINRLIHDSKQLTVHEDEKGIWIDNGPDYDQLCEGESAVNELVKRVIGLREAIKKLESLHKELGIATPTRKAK